MLKICTKCNINKQETTEFFQFRKNTGNFRGECLICLRERKKIVSKNWQQNNPERAKQNKINWRENNQEKYSNYNKEYNSKYKTEINPDYYQNNKDKWLKYEETDKAKAIRKEYENGRRKEIRPPKLGRTEPEKYIENFLIENNIKYEYEKTFENCRSVKNNPLHFDFWLPEQNSLIEFDGIFHFEPIFGQERLNEIKANDELKNKWCQENNIKLIRIFYKENLQESLNQIKII